MINNKVVHGEWYDKGNAAGKYDYKKGEIAAAATADEKKLTENML